MKPGEKFKENAVYEHVSEGLWNDLRRRAIYRTGNCSCFFYTPTSCEKGPDWLWRIRPPLFCRDADTPPRSTLERHFLKCVEQPRLFPSVSLAYNYWSTRAKNSRSIPALDKPIARRNLLRNYLCCKPIFIRGQVLFLYCLIAVSVYTPVVFDDLYRPTNKHLNPKAIFRDFCKPIFLCCTYKR